MEPEREDAIRLIAARDPRYKVEAYAFLMEALDFTITRRDQGRKHVSGPELMEGFRDLAVQTFGFLARAVLEEWGIQATDDVGRMVFHMIEEDLLQKTADDRREDFHELFDFAEAFEDGFRASLAKVAL